MAHGIPLICLSEGVSVILSVSASLDCICLSVQFVDVLRLFLVLMDVLCLFFSVCISYLLGLVCIHLGV